MAVVASRILGDCCGDVTGMDVFEFGCGTGRNLVALKAAGAASVGGCDLSEGMLAAARRREPALDVFRHDMNAPLPVAIGAADIVLFSLTLEHIADLAPPLGEARRLLKPGGRIVVIEIHPLLSLAGVVAHVSIDGEDIGMPTFPHQLADYLSAFAALKLEVASCREWRPRDLAGPLPAKVLKRGPDQPMVVSFSLSRSEQV